MRGQARPSSCTQAVSVLDDPTQDRRRDNEKCPCCSHPRYFVPNPAYKKPKEPPAPKASGDVEAPEAAAPADAVGASALAALESQPRLELLKVRVLEGRGF